MAPVAAPTKLASTNELMLGMISRKTMRQVPSPENFAAVTKSQAPFQIISGYRSPATNAQLRKASDGVASKSLHLAGQAIDIRLADVALPALRDAALSLGAGGVGYYPASDFVHVDTGRVRAW